MVFLLRETGSPEAFELRRGLICYVFKDPFGRSVEKDPQGTSGSKDTRWEAPAFAGSAEDLGDSVWGGVVIYKCGKTESWRPVAITGALISSVLMSLTDFPITLQDPG